eukprot:9465205-Pyramimonas_sp.AAC.2
MILTFSADPSEPETSHASDAVGKFTFFYERHTRQHEIVDYSVMLPRAKGRQVIWRDLQRIVAIGNACTVSRLFRRAAHRLSDVVAFTGPASRSPARIIEILLLPNLLDRNPA